MTKKKLELVRLHLTGFLVVFFQAGIGAMVTMWGLQILAAICGLEFVWEPVLKHLFLSFSFLAFFPGQEYWTVQVEGPDGQLHTIVGREPELY